MDASIFGLKDKVAIVVGGGLGIGRSSSLILADAGAHVTVVDVIQERAEAVAKEVRGLGRKALPVVIDARRRDQVEQMVQRTLRELGRVDVLVNVPTWNVWNRLEDFKEEDWDAVMEGALKYVFLTCAAAARAMIAQKIPGSLVSIASISGVDSAPYHAAYGAAKAGIIQLAKTMAVEWGPYGIRVNAIAPGSVKTPRAQAHTTPERDKQLSEAIPLGRRAETDDIARAVLFFASNLASYVTGETLLVDGGVMCNYSLPMESHALVQQATR